jgi:hypothetical protein
MFETRTSHKWMKSADKFNINHLNFEGDFPMIGTPLLSVPEGIEIVNCNDYKNVTSGSLICTFVDDYIIERFWNSPEKYVSKFSPAKFIMSPDYSLLVGMPEPLQQFNVYKNRLVGHVWQQEGLKVIPTISWADKNSLKYCFQGINFGSVVAVSNIGCRNQSHKRFFDYGFQAMVERVHPKQIVFMCNKKFRSDYEQYENITYIDSFFDRKRIENLI